MDAYVVHVVISYVKQISKLRPQVLNPVAHALERLCLKSGGRAIGDFKYEFLLELNESDRKAAKMAAAAFEYLKERQKQLLGFTILVVRKAHNPYEKSPAVLLLPGILEENRLWVQLDIAGDFVSYFQGEEIGKLFRVSGFLDSGPDTKEKLHYVLVRPSRLRYVVKAITTMKNLNHERPTLVLRGGWGSGKRMTLEAAMKSLYPDNQEEIITIPFSNSSEDPMEPFMRSLGQMHKMVSAEKFIERMQDDEREWWEKEGKGLADWAAGITEQRNFRDYGPVDIVQAIAICLSTILRSRKTAKNLTWLVIDGWPKESDALTWLHLLLGEYLGNLWFRLIIICDSEKFNSSLPILGKGHEVRFKTLPVSEILLLMDKLGYTGPRGNREIEELHRTCGSNLYRVFHYIMGYKRSSAGQTESEYHTPITHISGAEITNQIDKETLLLFFLAAASSDLSTRQMLMTRVGNNTDEQFRQQARLDTLLSLGLIRENSDGRIQALIFPPENLVSQIWRIEARDYGVYLFREYQKGKKINLIRLYRYLEEWGPVDHALHTLDTLLEELLTQHRLRTVTLLLSSPLMTKSELSGKAMEDFQCVISMARLRYNLLAEGAEKTNELVREGTISLISGQTSFADKAQLNNSRFYYAVRKWDDALKAAKESLFIFQKSSKHEGKTYAHLEMALCYLAMGKISDAQEHFGISRRVGSQIHPAWGGLRAAAMETLSFYIYGNLPRASREAQEVRKIASQHGRRDIWLLLTLLSIRISWDLCRFQNVIIEADAALKICNFYDNQPPAAVFNCWKGRALLANGNADGAALLMKMPHSREANTFLSEFAWNSGNISKARLYIQKAASISRKSTGLHGECDDWSDGFFPIEGRLSSEQENSREFLDFLGEWIEGFDAFLAASSGDSGQGERLKKLLNNGLKQRLRPGVSIFSYWAAMVQAKENREEMAHYISQSFNALQYRASHFDDNQAKRDWINRNPWNKLIMAESRNQKFAS